MFAHRLVSLPLTDLRKVREVLPGHFQGEIAIPAEEAVFDALPAADGYLALWARREEIARTIGIFQEAGCEPQVISSVPFGWGFLPGITDDCAISDGRSLALLRGGQLSFVRALDAGDPVRDLTATLSALELSGTPLPSRLYVFGEHGDAIATTSDLPLAVEFLELPTELAVMFRTDAAFQQLAGLYAVARACQAGGLPDFRRGELAWTAGDAAMGRQLRRTALLTVAALLLLFVWKGMQYRAVQTDLASLNGSIGSIYREIFPGRTKAVDELAEVKGEIRKLAGVENGGMVLDTLRKLAEAKGATINGLFEAEIEGRTVRLKGDARSAQAVNDFKAALSGLLATAEAGEVKSRPDGTVSFTLTGMLKEGSR